MLGIGNLRKQMSGSNRPAGGVQRRRPTVENLEGRRLLAGDVAASLVGDTLEIVGDNSANNVLLRTIQREQADTRIVNDGTTSVSLDFDLLESAAGLTFDSASDDVPPATGFAVGFDITEASTFQFSTESGFELIGGAIEHAGTVTFLNTDGDLITLGNFTIGFDAERVSEEASGFFVADTASVGIPVFDLSPPEVLDFDDPNLVIASTDLLLSPELATALAGENSGLDGEDVGDARVDATVVDFQQREVEDGKTSVFLDTDLLEEAALLRLTGASGTAEPAVPVDPAGEDFLVAFDISDDTDFQFSFGNSFAPVGGSIEHTGSVTFELLENPGDESGTEIVLGDFSIGFDPSREGVSGFFVADTLSLNIPLFDIAGPAVDFSDPTLVVSGASLLVSPELANALAAPALTGEEVGAAQIDAVVDAIEKDFIQVTGRNRLGRTTINGERRVEFPAEAVDSVFVDLGRGADLLNVSGLHVTGDLTIDMGAGFFNYMIVNRSEIGGKLDIRGGAGFDGITVNRSTMADLAIDSGASNDYVTVSQSEVAGDADIDLGAGWFDSLVIWRSSVQGDATLSGGSGRLDRFASVFSSFGSLTLNGFERRRIF